MRCTCHSLTRASSHFVVNNILEGMIWFFVPASLVICNDIFAYIWGVTLGRTPLIKLSPKKTVEGFLGAFFSTVIFGEEESAQGENDLIRMASWKVR